MKINSAGGPDRSEVDARVLVDDIGPECDVIGGGNAVFIGLVHDAVIPVRKPFRFGVHADGEAFSISKPFAGTFLQGLVHPSAGFLPHAEGPIFNRGGDILRCPAIIGQFKVMDAAGAIAAYMGDPPHSGTSSTPS